MLAYLRDSNDSKSVIDIFENLYLQLGPDIFSTLMPEAEGFLSSVLS